MFNDDQLYRLTEIARLLGEGRSTVESMYRSEDFPAPLYFDAKLRVFPGYLLNAFLRNEELKGFPMPFEDDHRYTAEDLAHIFRANYRTILRWSRQNRLPEHGYHPRTKTFRWKGHDLNKQFERHNATWRHL